MIFQKKYSIYFYISLIIVILYGLFALYVLVSSQWGQVVIPDDTVVFQEGVFEIAKMAGGYLVIFRPVYLLLSTYVLVEHWVRYGEKYE